MRRFRGDLFLLAHLLFSLTAEGGSVDQRLDVYWIDVEGGAATLIVTPAGESVLVDTGNPGRRDPDRIVQVATKVAGIKRIDNLIITHYHRDHYGGASTLATMLPIGRVFDNGVFDDMPDHPGKAYFEFPCQERIVIKPGDTIPLKQPGGITLSLLCLAAQQKFVSPERVDAERNDVLQLHRAKDRRSLVLWAVSFF